MRFIHTADLHIGKLMHEFSLIEDQEYILNQIVDLCVEHKADAIGIAGDVYDRAVPAKEAVEVFDAFLTKLSEKQIKVFLISGNHDSPQRLSFGSEIFAKQGIYLAGMQDGSSREVLLEDEYGKISFTLLPFVKAGMVGCATMDEAVAKMLLDEVLEEKPKVRDMEKQLTGEAEEEKPQVEEAIRKVLVTHYFVANGSQKPELSEAESGIYVGGLDLVDVGHFKYFDYVALGHIHKPQQVGERPVYYAGAPLAYSFSEAGKEKSVLLVEMKEKGNVEVTRLELSPLRQVRAIKGRLEELVQEDIVTMENRMDYLQVTLTDKEESVDALGVLRGVYPNTMQLIMEKDGIATNSDELSVNGLEEKSEAELFAEFYEFVTEEVLDEEKQALVTDMFKELKGVE